ncbi:Glyoxylase, beta-lactamase superfamily II [Caloramator quimbayensis]|uniref:Glyoxylase, beta-lactamase superfamily II n=1 Tax=Caloramator quimbayensis TaxID=1147123 RepID=A0A1T4XUL7_9CLOT|nr:MBL fold metallo-hydrolase [Caloramator quimbayensis]SKA93230.1 Glyoxylase, beta-lactamase superfamily II [Caloramator quimbayensis]
MKLNKIKGDTYYIDAPTNSGIYTFKNKSCVIIDTGISISSAKRIDSILIENGLKAKYIINTHSHMDHCGGNKYFKNTYPGSIIYSSQLEKIFIENPDFFPTILFSSSPIKSIEKNLNSIQVDFTLEYGINKINDEKFEIIPLKGHFIEQIGIITPERVCFIGDAVFSDEIIEKYSLPFLFDIKESLNTLNFLKEVEADYFVLGHCCPCLTRNEFLPLIDRNINNIEKYNEQILELLDQPLTREDLLENLVILNNLEMEFRQYHLNLSAVSAFIKYLYDENLISYSIEEGKLFYYK